MTLQEFVGQVVLLGHSMIAEDEAPLGEFLRHVVCDPERLRVVWLGQTSEERRSLTPARRRMLDVLGRSPDLLELTRGRWDERSHTEVIAWFLANSSPARSSFLRLLEERSSPFDVDRPAAGMLSGVPTWTVQPERAVAGGRVDVWLESSHALVPVEGKVGVGEGPDQLKRYRSAAEAVAKGRAIHVVLLTLGADQTPASPALHVTFLQLLVAWLPVAVDPSSEHHQALATYLASLARLTRIGGPGEFDDWSHSDRWRALELVREA